MGNLIDLGLLLLSDLNLMLMMLIVIMIAACFLGRSIVISKKLLFAGLGMMCLSVFLFFEQGRIFQFFQPDVYARYLQNPEGAEEIEAYRQFAAVANTVITFVVYGYVFVFFLFSYQEKRVRRSIESLVCLYLALLFFRGILYYEYLYFTGGRWETHMEYLRNVGPEYIAWQSFTTIASFFIYSAVAAILYFGYYRKKVYYSIKLSHKILFAVWILLFLAIPILPFTGETDNMEERYLYLCYAMCIFIPLLGIVWPIFLIMNTSARALKEENDAQARYLEAELEYIERYKNAQTQTRAFRHDVVNNLSVATMLLEQGKKEEAQAHLQEMLGEVRSLSPRFVTGDEMLDCIVSIKAEKMEKNGIAFSLDGVLDGGLKLKPMDTCSIFANALDNAIEAASQTKEPKVSLNIRRTDQFFVISIENSAPSRVEVEKLFSGEGYTTKKDKEFHGFGLRNIQKTVEENEGLLKATFKEGEFALSIMIPR
ncbi:MAG: GHKL domain-containing protein [Lachnospiraceae bacterium]|nr:GHKL domain-containing protein [Lachnospiraceae bacterium]